MSEQAIDMDGLDASLDDLLKAADASDVKDRLVKAVGGYSAEYSGRTDEDGHGGGGVASMSDAGGLDDMMIGKMIDAGVAASTVADFVAFMTAKAEDEDEDEDEDDEDMNGYYKGRYAPSGESFSKSFADDNDIAQAVDASPFMEALTMRTTQALDGLHKSAAAQAGRQNSFNGTMARAVGQMGKLVKSQQGVISELASRLGIVERAPMPQRGATSAEGMRKSMPGGATQGGGNDSLTKGEVVNTLTYMNLQKGIKTVAGQKTGEMAVMLEAGGSIDRDTIDEVSRFLATHPNEAKLAKSYQ